MKQTVPPESGWVNMLIAMIFSAVLVGVSVILIKFAAYVHGCF